MKGLTCWPISGECSEEGESFFLSWGTCNWQRYEYSGNLEPSTALSCLYKGVIEYHRADLELHLQRGGLIGGHLSGRGDYSLVLLVDSFEIAWSTTAVNWMCSITRTYTSKWKDWIYFCEWSSLIKVKTIWLGEDLTSVFFVGVGVL